MSLLTICCVFSWVFDVRWEFGKDVDASCVSFWMFGSQSGISGDKMEKFEINLNTASHRKHVFQCVLAYRGGVSFSSKNSSILLTSTLTSPLKVTKGGLVPGARLWRSAGFLITQKSGACGHSHVYHSHCMNTCMRLHHVTAWGRLWWH